MAAGVTLANGDYIALGQVPELAWDAFAADVIAGGASGSRLAALFGVPRRSGARLIAVQADRETGLLALSSAATAESFPSITPQRPAAHLFEREIAEQLGLVPVGHPWFKPVRFHAAWVPGRDAWRRPEGEAIVPSGAPFFRVEGEEIHEVAVGPVHAGVIEPGHFRFNCRGEEVLHLEISLGYQHRGIERALIGGPDHRTVHLLETAAGDSSIAHCSAYAAIIEALAGIEVTPRAQVLRGIALELERLANHAGDLGALAGDVGFLPTASHCGRLRGDLLNLTALLCGSRFGRGLVRPGGTRFNATPALVEELLRRLGDIERDLRQSVELLFDTPSVQGRFEGTGTITAEQALQLGVVGPAARACGLELDARADFPIGIYRFAQLPVSTWPIGDVAGRARVRWLEVQRSLSFVREQVVSLPEGETRVPLGALAPESIAVSLVEGWRGEVCHVALTDAGSRFAAYKVVDPSFHNWAALALAMRGQQISDFPLCNKSFNLSYCGHDL